MKYSDKKYEISSSYRATLENRISIFRESATIGQTIHLNMTTKTTLHKIVMVFKGLDVAKCEEV